MERRLLAALISCIISEITLLLLFSFPNDLTTLHHSPPTSSLLPLLLHLLTSSTTAASLLRLSYQSPPPPPPSRKRKRLTFPQTPPSPSSEETAENATENLANLSASLHLPELDSFKLHFRMSSATFQWLSGLLEPLLDCRDPAGSPLNLSAGVRLGIGLSRLATGSRYPDIAARFGVKESTARFCTKQLCRVLCTNFRFWVAFPGDSDMDSVSDEFETASGLPNCCGVIDCTRFKIQMEKSHDFSIEEDGDQDESVVAQIVVDSSSRILSIITGFHGDKGDSRVLRSSSLYKDIEGGKFLNSPPIYIKGVPVPQYLVGDSGYPLLPWLMVPFAEPVSASSEEDFNIVHYLMRQPVLRTFASLRNWGVLDRPIQEDTKMAVACIGACAILHNVLLLREDYTALSDGVADYSSHDQSSQYYRDASLEECLIEKKSAVVRGVLASKAREVRGSTQLICL